MQQVKKLSKDNLLGNSLILLGFKTCINISSINTNSNIYASNTCGHLEWSCIICPNNNFAKGYSNIFTALHILII